MMQLQTNSHTQGTLFAMLGAIETSVSGYHDSSFTNSSLANNNLWHSAKEIGSTQMTPLAQSFQTLYNTLERLSYSLEGAGTTAELSSLITQETSSHERGTSDPYALPEFNPLASEVSTLKLADEVTVISSHMTDSVSSTTVHIESNDSDTSIGIESALLTGAPVPSEVLNEGDKAAVSEESPPLRTKLSSDVAFALDSSLSYSSSLVDVPAFKNGGETVLPVQGISRQQTSNSNATKLVQRLQEETLFAPSSDSLGAEMNILAQYASSMQSHTPSSLKVNEASWKAVVGQLQPMNNQSAINSSTNTLAVSAESLASAIDSLGSRATLTNLAVEKSLPIEAQRQIYQAVKDKVQLQVDMNTQVARIRFDPPELGRMEMVLRIEGDKLTVQMSASAATTREALMATSERLRHELIAQNSALSEVEVALSQQHHSASPEQYLPSFAEQEHEDSSGEGSPNVPEYTAYIARV
jgi:flagellar hook-length control protein FliK